MHLTGPFGIRIDSEVLRVTAVTGTTFTVARTTPVPHSAGATVVFAPLTNLTKMFRYDTLDTFDTTNWSVNAKSPIAFQDVNFDGALSSSLQASDDWHTLRLDQIGGWPELRTVVAGRCIGGG